MWVANDLAFPAGDCRAADPDVDHGSPTPRWTTWSPSSTATCIPKETGSLQHAARPRRHRGPAGPDANGNGGDYTGGGDKTVTLVDNVRDDNFYDFPAAPTYIAGFFSAQFNELVDRNVMTIDAFDWLHRTGANPPNAPTDDLCTSRPARPTLYEGTFAHEWQHLLHYYTDPFETHLDQRGSVRLRADAHRLRRRHRDGVRPRRRQPPLLLPGLRPGADAVQHQPAGLRRPAELAEPVGRGRNPNAVLADYGIAYPFMLFLYDRYGPDFMSRLHRDGDAPGPGRASTPRWRPRACRDMYRVIHDFQTMTLVDKIVGDSQPRHHARRAQEAGDHAEPALDGQPGQPDRYRHTPGAAPNGADYVPLQKADGQVLRGRDLRSVNFEGAKTLPPLPLAWTVVTNDPDRRGNPVLWSGNANNTDATAVTSVAVPAADPTLRFLAKYGAEVGFDYGYVVVSTDGGATYTADRRRQDRRRAARTGHQRHDDRLRAAHLRPVRVRRARPSCSASGTSATAASTRAAG